MQTYILHVRDQDGNFVPIPALQGPTGHQGPEGPAG